MKYFKITDFTCRCGCKRANMESEFLEKLDATRELAGVPFIVISGFRCISHNQAVGSTSTNHTRGLAADIACTSSRARIKIIDAAIKIGFKRIGIHKDFIHMDINDGPDACVPKRCGFHHRVWSTLCVSPSHARWPDSFWIRGRRTSGSAWCRSVGAWAILSICGADVHGYQRCGPAAGLSAWPHDGGDARDVMGA